MPNLARNKKRSSPRSSPHSCPGAEASQKTTQPNGSTTSQNFSAKGGTSLALIDTFSPLRVPMAPALAQRLVSDDQTPSPVPAFGNDPRASLASSCSWCRQWSLGVR